MVAYASLQNQEHGLGMYDVYRLARKCQGRLFFMKNSRKNLSVIIDVDSV